MATSRFALVGVIVFAVAHGVLRLRWDLFGPAHEPWFLNSARAAGLMCGATAIAAAVAGMRAREAQTAVGRAVAIAAGALATSVVVLVSGASGPGTLAPIVVVVSACALTAAALVGAIAGFGIRTASSARRP
jgi:hypothetical protein